MLFEIVPPVDQRPHLHQAGFHLLQDAGVDAGVEPGAGQPSPTRGSGKEGDGAPARRRRGTPVARCTSRARSPGARCATRCARRSRIDPLQLPLQHLPPLPARRASISARKARPGARRDLQAVAHGAQGYSPVPPTRRGTAPGGGCARWRPAPGAGTAPPSRTRPGRPRPAGGGGRGPAPPAPAWPSPRPSSGRPSASRRRRPPPPGARPAPGEGRLPRGRGAHQGQHPRRVRFTHQVKRPPGQPV